jgi:ATP-binding cassette subfamily B multidrug efflux pump
MSYKKLIPNIYLKDEKAYADKDLSVLLGNGDAVAAANRFSENGADEILVMDNGCVKGFGTHEELLKTCPLYKEIFDIQISKEVG